MRSLVGQAVCMQLLWMLLGVPAFAQQPYEDLQEGSLAAKQAPAKEGRELTIQEAIDRTVARGLTVEQAIAERDAQKEAKRAAMSLMAPSVTLSYRHSIYKHELSSGTTIFRDEESKFGSLVARQPITGLYAGLKNAQIYGLSEERANEGLKQAKADAAILGAQAFLMAYGAQEGVAISEASLAASKSAHNDAKVLNRVGRLNQADLLKFQLALSQSETRAAQARAQKAIAFANLANTVRLDPTDVVHLKQELPSPEALSGEGNTEEIAKNRPEWKQADIAEAQAQDRRQSQYAAFVPIVNAFYEIDHNYGKMIGFPGTSERETRFYGIEAQWEVWSSGKSVFAVREAGAQYVKARAAATQARDAVRLDILQSREQYKAAQEALKQAEAGVAQADEAYRIDQIRFKSGQISATDLIQSESMRTNARGQQINARTEFLTWHLRLQKSLGVEQPKL